MLPHPPEPAGAIYLGANGAQLVTGAGGAPPHCAAGGCQPGATGTADPRGGEESRQKDPGAGRKPTKGEGRRITSSSKFEGY